MKLMDYFTKQKGFIIEGKAFAGQEDAIAYLKKVCCMTGDEATRYTNAMIAAYEHQCTVAAIAAAVEGGTN